MRPIEAVKYLGSGLVVYAVMAACADGGGVTRVLTDASPQLEGDGPRRPDSGGPRRPDSGPVASEAGLRDRFVGPMEGGLLDRFVRPVEGGLLDRFVHPVEDAVAQQTCATCTGGAFRMITADTDPSQRVRGTVSLTAVGPTSSGQSTYVTRKVADGPLFVTTADAVFTGTNEYFTYYVVRSDATCGAQPGDPDDATATVGFGNPFPGVSVATIIGDALRSAKAFVLADEKLCVGQRISSSAVLDAATLQWAGYRPYGDG